MTADDAPELDRVLQPGRDSRPRAELRARVLAGFDRHRRRPRTLWRRLCAEAWPEVPVWKPAIAFALSLVIGMAAGTLAPNGEPFGGSGDEFVAFGDDAMFDFGEDL